MMERNASSEGVFPPYFYLIMYFALPDIPMLRAVARLSSNEDYFSSLIKEASAVHTSP